MNKWEVVPATDQDALEIAGSLSFEDVREAWSSAKLTPHRAVLKSFRLSKQVWAGKLDGRVLCLLGVVPHSIISTRGTLWLIGAKDLPQHARGFLKHSRRAMPEVLKAWTYLSNYTDERNSVIVNWVKWLGFTTHAPEPHGPFNLPFVKFEMVINGNPPS